MAAVDEKTCAARENLTEQLLARQEANLTKLEDKYDKMAELNINIAALVKQHEDKIADHDKRIGTLEGKPGEYWKLLVASIISVLVGTILPNLSKLLGG